MWAVARAVALWVFGDDLVKYALYIVGALLLVAYGEATAATAAIMSQPWGQWWLAGVGGGATGAMSGPTTTIGSPPPVGAALPVTVPPPHPGFVTDVERVQVARAAGFPVTDLLLAVAISFAEDGSGDPAALSPPNHNGTFDLGLWQINSIHWANCGGQAALTVPLVNAVCAVSILGPGRNWCAWSTYEESCGVGHTGSYRAYIARARAAVAAAQGG